MKRKAHSQKWRGWALAAMIFCGVRAVPAHGQDGFRAEVVAAAPSGLAEPIAKALLLPGARLISSDGKVIAELWLRKDVPLKANAAAEGTLVGVLHFPQGGADFRGQTIAAGVYTLRFEHIPQDGNHLGAAPESDFLLLCPAAEDRELDATFNFESLVKLSRHATQTNHPGPLMLLPASGVEFPGVQRNDLGHVALRMKTSAKPNGSGASVDLPLALVLVGRAE